MNIIPLASYLLVLFIIQYPKHTISLMVAPIPVKTLNNEPTILPWCFLKYLNLLSVITIDMPFHACPPICLV